MRFPSKVDWWLAIILAVIPVVAIGATVASWSQPDRWVGLVAVAFVIAIYGGLVFPLYYEVGDQHLLVRFGLARYRVSYGDITRVEPSHNPLSSPALSLDRMRIDRSRGSYLLISPRDRDGFLRALGAKTPHLRREGERLVPAGSAQG